MSDDITRAEIEQAKEKLLDGLQFARHRLKEFQLQAALGGDEQPMLDEMAKIDRIEAKLAGLGYGSLKVEQNERAAESASRVAARRAAAEEVRSLMESHVSALAELEAMATKMLPVWDQIGQLADDIGSASARVFPAQPIPTGILASFTPQESFLVGAGVLQTPDVGESLQTVIDFARRVAKDRDRALQKVAAVVDAVAETD
ncbi:hypothetical protein GGR90_002761 [Sphingopyxis italica]|uniref:Uncharacterized protein n=1 Tax=Sphingopyxis italica TaxID=1129133 RepID=A0A7X5XSL9_9SPHN|nr:hypothetical protein [Sphingopyxis italica]NJB90567.1 hypothetical protein [Sphingopyxis italica]